MTKGNRNVKTTKQRVRKLEASNAQLARRVAGNPVNMPGPVAPRNVKKYLKGEEDKKAVSRHLRDGKLLDPRLRAWVRFHEAPMTANPRYQGKLLDIPFTDGSVPCLHNSVERYSEAVLTANSSGLINLWLFPNGSVESDTDQDRVGRLVNLSTYAYAMGPQNVNGGTYKAIWGYCLDAASSLAPDSWSNFNFQRTAQVTNGAGTFAPMLWQGEVETPWTFTTGHPGESYRCVGFELQVTYVGKAQDAKGILHSMQAWENTDDLEFPTSLLGAKTYKKHYFTNNRTVRIPWTGGCDTANQVLNGYNAGIATTEQQCNWAVCITDADSAAKYEFTTYAVYSITRTESQAGAKPGVVSQHAAHAQTGLLSRALAGTSKLMPHVVKAQAEGHPWIRAAENGVSDRLEGAGMFSLATKALALI